MRKAWLLLAASLCGCILGSGDDRQARGSVVENEIAGVLIASAGSAPGPASGARVRLFAADSNAPQGPALAETLTGADGAYRFDSLPEGTYAVLGSLGELLSFRDGVVLGEGGAPGPVVNLAGDTLRPPGAIEVQVALRPGDDAGTVSGEVLGTDFHADAGGDGDLSMSGMPAGMLRIRFTSSLSGYAPLVVVVEVLPGATTPAGIVNLPY